MSHSDSSDVVTSRIDGDDPPVVFLHGLFGQGKNFASIAKALAPQRGSILVDLPNHGDSAWTSSVDYQQMADAVADVIREQAGGRAAVVGHSMGGKVAMVVALEHPELVERLCVVDISPVATSGMSEFAGLLDALVSLDLAAIDSRRAADEALAPKITHPGVRGFLLQNLRHRDGRWVWRANLDLLRRDLPRIGRFPGELDAASYDGPVLWVAGADSPYIKEEHAERMRSLFPRVRKVTVKDAGHWVHSEQQAIFIEILSRFVGADGPRSDEVADS